MNDAKLRADYERRERLYFEQVEAFVKAGMSSRHAHWNVKYAQDTLRRDLGEWVPYDIEYVELSNGHWAKRVLYEKDGERAITFLPGALHVGDLTPTETGKIIRYSELCVE